MIRVEVSEGGALVAEIHYSGLVVTKPDFGSKFKPGEKKGVIVKPENMIPEKVVQVIAEHLEIGKVVGKVDNYSWTKNES